MFKTIINTAFILLAFGEPLHGTVTVIKAKCEGGISIYGKVGVADITLEEDSDKKSYKMKVETSSIGLVKALSFNRHDIFVSEGVIKDGLYLPHRFIKHTLKDDLDEMITYLLDYENKTLLKTTKVKKTKHYYGYDIQSFEIIPRQKIIETDESEYIDFQSNDFLTLYLNLKNNKLKTGNISYIDKKDEDNLQLINKNLFEVQKDNGRTKYHISFLNDNGFLFKRAVALDIFFYGDAYIEKLYEKTEIIHH
ncbi:MAG: hypothetical protein WC665_02050 [Sulfurimonas sp.]